MKLESPSRFTSFYESFSDLIFATMAIFVLLLTVFLTLIKPQSNPENLKEKLDQAEKVVVEQSEQLTKAKFERDNARELLQQLTTALTKMAKSVKAQGLELVIAVDVTGSMSEALGYLVETITTISETMPIISPKYRIGIVAYRQGSNDLNPLQVFPLQQIFSEQKDRGRSFQLVSEFLDGLKASNGLAPVGLAVNSAIDMLSASNTYSGYQVLLLLGDTGPYENSLDDLWFTQDKKRHEAPIINRIVSWVNGSDRRRVISLFSGKTNPAWQPEYQAYYKEKLKESRRFFSDVATASGQPENFTQDPGKMLVFLLNAIVNN